MSHEQPIGTGPVTITSNYQYILGYMKANMLSFQADFSSGGWTRQELDIISHELENTAKFFAEEQGLNHQIIPELSVNGNEVSIETGPSGKLYNSIKSHIHGDSVVLSANAKNSRNQYYAGHIEYGFHDRGGNFILARPFLRPALYAVSESSKGRIAYTMKELLESLWVEGGYEGYAKISSFGRLRRPSGGIRTFYNQVRYGKNSGLYTAGHYKKTYSLQSKNNNFRQKLRQGHLRKGFSANRYDKNDSRDRNSFKAKTKRSRPRIYYNKLRSKAGRLKTRRKRETKQRFEAHMLRKSARRKAANFEPMSKKEMKTLSQKEQLDYEKGRREQQIKAGTLRNSRAEKDRARRNREKNKSNKRFIFNIRD